ncbi:hypothetical protein Tco_0685503 [Tanacetum coccineum]
MPPPFYPTTTSTQIPPFGTSLPPSSIFAPLDQSLWIENPPRPQVHTCPHCQRTETIVTNLQDEMRSAGSVQLQSRFCFILPNHDTGRILLDESQRNTIDPSITVIHSSATNYDSADESLEYSTTLPLLKKLDGAEPISEPKTIKSILRSKSTFKAKALKRVIINEPSSASTKGRYSSLASKVHSAPAGKLKNMKIEDDPSLAIVMKELNDLKL